MLSWSDQVDKHELDDIMSSYGRAEVEEVVLDVDEDLFQNRLSKTSNRRGEVVFAIRVADGILVHHKSFYADGVFRLLSGGIDHGEKVVDALSREIKEETGLDLTSARLLGVQDCRLVYQRHSVRFVSYIFYVHAEGDLHPDPKESITEFKAVSAEELAAIAQHLRQVPPPYEGWGRWRALAHDLVYRRLTEMSRNRRDM